MVLAQSLSSGCRERVPALAVGPLLQRPAELLRGLVQLGSMLVVKLGTRGQRFRELDDQHRTELNEAAKQLWKSLESRSES